MSNTNKKEVIIDCRGHMLGRLASIVAKELLNGQQVTAVRCEGINMSGSLYRCQLKYAEFKRKTNNCKPSHGPFHYRAPSKIFWRTVRGMVPHKTARGAAALDRLKTFEGMPHPYDIKKKMVIPQALKCLRMKPYRKYCVLGDLSNKVGWKCQDLLKRLETQRGVRAKAYGVRKMKKLTQVKKGKQAAKGKLSKDEQNLLAKTETA